jgi:hypothetical protein
MQKAQLLPRTAWSILLRLWKDPETKKLKKKYIGKNIVLLTSREKKANKDSTNNDIEDLPF